MAGVKGRSGRKPMAVYLNIRMTAAELLDLIGEREAWVWCYQQAVAQLDVRTVLDLLRFLTEKRDGRAAQAVNVHVTQGAAFTPQELERARELVREMQAARSNPPMLAGEVVQVPDTSEAAPTVARNRTQSPQDAPEDAG